MEYLIGAIVMFVTLNLINRHVAIKARHLMLKKPLITQSMALESTRMFSVIVNRRKELNTQATVYFDKTNLKVIISENKAYWVLDNALFCADMVDGDIDRNSTKKVDTMALNKVELDKMIFIVDQLSGGHNDSGNSGNKKF